MGTPPGSLWGRETARNRLVDLSLLFKDSRLSFFIIQELRLHSSLLFKDFRLSLSLLFKDSRLSVLTIQGLQTECPYYSRTPD